MQRAEQTLTADLTKKTTPMVLGETPICDKHGVEKESLNLSLDSSKPSLRWYCLKCGDEQEQQEKQAIARREMARKQETINSNLQNAMIAPRFLSKTFENFQAETSEQKQTLKRVQEFVEKFGESTGLIFTGKPGTGKNHLASAIAREVVTTKGKTALITTALKIIRTIKESWSGGKESDAIKKFLEPDLLVIDELGVQFGSETEKLYLTEIINDRYEWFKQTLILTNLTIAELSKILGDRVIDRFREGGRVLVFNWESHRGRGAEA